MKNTLCRIETMNDRKKNGKAQFRNRPGFFFLQTRGHVARWFRNCFCNPAIRFFFSFFIGIGTPCCIGNTRFQEPGRSRHEWNRVLVTIQGHEAHPLGLTVFHCQELNPQQKAVSLSLCFRGNLSELHSGNNQIAIILFSSTNINSGDYHNVLKSFLF